MSHRRLLLFLLFWLQRTNQPDQQTDNEKCARCQQEQAVWQIPAAVLHRVQHRDAKQLAAANQLAQEPHGQQDHAVTQAVANAVHKARQRRHFHGVSFRTPHDDTVGDNQPDKHRELFGGFIGEGAQQLIDHDHQRGDDRHLYDDPHAVGDMVADHRDKHAGERRDQRYRQRHHNRRFQLGRHRQSRTDPQNLERDRVIG
ncbi:hypothetical protein L1887_60407 [Cichorium endivia]|nr:hypothetical protein L1887_60407 [Cichorium endivia]